ncbi:MAG: tRNA (N6-isopentenyl adenosine(37)-C2)-methylthiotransferase MiaB [Deltaproteobacteria bacterium]
MEQERYLFVETHGCQMNDSDSGKITSLMSACNYRTTSDIGKADIVILNTCSVRDKAEHKVYSYLGTLKSYKERNPNLIIGVGGCVAQQEGERLLKRVPHLDIVFGTHNIHKLPELVSQVRRNKERVAETRFYENGLDIFPAPVFGSSSNSLKGLVNVMLGCDNFCSYCVVPYVRGREISRPSAGIVKEIEGLVSSGVKEVTLIGQNVNSYGRGLDEGTDFPTLLRKVNGINGLKRIRFMTSHPKDISDPLISSFGKLDKLCEHLHLPVQSGSDSVLKKMNRSYSSDGYLSRVQALRDLSPGMALTSDIIVGFPGETDEDFDATMGLVEKVRYDAIFSFKFSPRLETKAAGMPDQVNEGLKNERLLVLQERQREISLERNMEYEGKVVEVLVEGGGEKNHERLSGKTRSFKTVKFDGNEELVGELVQVRIEKGYVNSLIGKLV